MSFGDAGLLGLVGLVGLYELSFVDFSAGCAKARGVITARQRKAMEVRDLKCMTG